jgi:hypothetical protein
MNYYEVSRGLPTPCIHPLLLSLAEAWSASNSPPDLHSISESNSRVIGSQYYILASELSPLNTHFSGNNDHLGIISCLTAMQATNQPQGETGSWYIGSCVLQSNYSISVIQNLEQEVRILKAKCVSYEGMLEALQNEVLQISQCLNILDHTGEGCSTLLYCGLMFMVLYKVD